MSSGRRAAEDGFERFLEEIPKVELHVHLEGAIRPATLLELARRRRVGLPAADEEGLTEWFRFRDFDHFVEVFLLISRCLRDPEDFQLVVDDFLAEQERQRIFYTEAHFTISTHVANGANAQEVADAMAEAIAVGEKRRGVRLRLIPDIVRNAEYRRADQTVEWALANQGRTVVALGIAGKEGHPTAPFEPHFAAARAAGLGCVAHAGEQAGPESIEAALAYCRPQRLGHGIRAIEDAGLLERLRASSLPLEVCPTSNVCLGLVPDLEAHPFGELRRAGLELTLNSDDPALFNTDLVSEYRRIARAFGLDALAVRDLALAAVRHSFLPAEEKSVHLAELPRRFADLAERHLDRPLELSDA